MSLTLTDYIARVEEGVLHPSEIVMQYQQKVKEEGYNAFLRMHEAYVEEHLDEFSSRPLKAAPIGVKDIILTKGYETTCASRILQGYIPPYSATCFSRLERAGGLMVGKTNMDEFAMGGSNENSAFGPVKNPHDEARIPGGSSGGSAVAVAADLCLAALGTDTGGSVRQPAAMCGVVGTKPTYGRVSRYGVQAMASSLDQVGTFTKTVNDAVLLLKTIAGYDEQDATTMPRDADMEDRKAGTAGSSLTGKRIAVPQQYFDEGLESNVRERQMEVLEYCRELGAQVDRIDIPLLKYGIPTYYILMPAEASTNLARFDGIRFGMQQKTDEFSSVFDYYAHIREAGFGDEVKRRVLTGTYVLSEGFYDAYYRKALKVKSTLQADIKKLYTAYDAIVGPTTPSVAWKLGAKGDDPIAMYLADIYTVTANLTGFPALSLPVGTVQQGTMHLPVGFQIMCNHRDEKMMFELAGVIEGRF